MKLCAVVPVYNHGAAVGAVLAGLRSFGLQCLLVDDGSEPGCARILDDLAAREPASCKLIRLTKNGGKGAAMIAGMHAAGQAGYSHILQVDADGQHDLTDVPRFIELARAHPDHVITGYPIFDTSVPAARYYGRYATHVWVWINTLSLQIRDAMCGFRVYPLESTLALIDGTPIGQRMEFDIEILVRLSWRGVTVTGLPTRVRYPLDGVSHFHIGRDNLLITWMHTRLFFGMLGRLPMLVARRLVRP